MKTAFRYINQVYLIDGGELDSSVIPYLVEEAIYCNRQDQNIQKLIISNTKYDFQYVSYGFTVMETSKDDSILVTEENVITLLKERMNVKTGLSIPPNLIPFTIALLGDKYRNIPKMAGVGLSTILKMVHAALERVIITPQTQNVDMLSKIITEPHRKQFIKNYLCTYIPEQYEAASPMNVRHIEEQMVDKFDDNAMNYMNERYFKMAPLMLIGSKTEQMVEQINQQSSIWGKL